MAIRATISIELLQASVSAARTTTSVTYELSHATGIWTDPDSNNRMPKDEFPLSDVRFSLVEKNLSETVTLDDVVGWSYDKSKLETLALVESFAKVVSYNRAFNDAFTLDDLSQIDKDFYGNKGNVAFMLDIIGLTYHKDFTNKNQLNLGTLNSGELNDDGSEDDRRVTVSDVVTLALDWVRTFTDSYSFTDTNSYEFIKNVEDAFTLDDTSLINKDFYGDKGNVFGFSDLLGSSFGKTLTDSISQLDEVSILQGLNKSDSTTLSDTYRTTLNKAISDAFTLDDALQVDKDYFGNKGNVFTFSDVLSYEASKDLIDGIALVELVGFVLNHPVEDSYTVTDTNTLQPELVKSDSIGFSDIYIRNIMKGLSDGFALDDTAQVNKDTDSAKGNIFSFSDVFSRTVSYDRDYTDNFGFSDIIGLDQNKVLTDSYTVSDVIEVAMLWVRGFTDTFKVYDENPNALNVNLLNSQAMNAQDTAFLVDRGLDKGDALGFSEITAFNHAKVLSDLATFNDVYGLQLVKTLSDSFTLDDDALVNKNYIGNKGNIMSLSDLVAVNLIRSNQLGTRNLNTMPLN